MGIRIEDSVCVQKESPLILTTEAVKEVCETLLAKNILIWLVMLIVPLDC